jgi:pimeloyl-ACP methyl ester carboxylesterase
VRVDEHTIYLDESPVFYRSAAPPVPGTPALYLHGIPTSSDDWVQFLARTGGIAPDLIGFGRSGKGGHLDYSVAGLTQFLERFLVEIQVERVKLVAHDWGAAVGLALAARHPERVERLVLVNPPPILDGFELPRLVRLWRTALLGEGLMGATTRGMLARALRRGSVRDDAWPDTRVAAVWDQFDQGTQRAILRLVRDARPASHQTTLAPPLINAPALIIWGDRDPWYAPPVADAYAARLPGAKVERLPDAGHWPWLDRPDLVDRVAAFLEE